MRRGAISCANTPFFFFEIKSLKTKKNENGFGPNWNVLILLILEIIALENFEKKKLQILYKFNKYYNIIYFKMMPKQLDPTGMYRHPKSSKMLCDDSLDPTGHY